jgi:hypothetical protein
MFKILKKLSITLSFIALLAILSSAIYASSGSGFIEGSSAESTVALFENPSFEGQLVRANTGINLVRLNTDILENMPVSVDSTWVDVIIGDVNMDQIRNLSAYKNDAYYSTIFLTNLILQRGRSLPLTPLVARLFHQANTIYKTIPNMNVLPDLSDTKSFVTFADAKLIKVEAKKGNLFKNVEEAVISLLPEDMIETTKSAKDDYKEAMNALRKAEGKVEKIKLWLDDDENDNSLETKTYEADLETAEAKVIEEEDLANLKKEIYFKAVEDGILALETDYDENKLPLAKKLEKLLDIVDNNAIGATSLFSSAIVGLTRGLGQLQKEQKAINTAIIRNANVDSQTYKSLVERNERMLKGSVMLIPDIGIGSLYAVKQSLLAGKYQKIVDVIIEMGKVEAEAKESAIKMKAESAKKPSNK